MTNRRALEISGKFVACLEYQLGNCSARECSGDCTNCELTGSLTKEEILDWARLITKVMVNEYEKELEQRSEGSELIKDWQKECMSAPPAQLAI